MDEYTAADAHAAVQHGAQWLDQLCPEWVKEIDLGKLRMASGNYCILGQTADCLVPDHVVDTEYADRFSLVSDTYGKDTEWLVAHGFDAFTGNHTEYEMLQIAWSELIRERLLHA